MTKPEERTVEGYVANWLYVVFDGKPNVIPLCSFVLNTRTELASESEGFSIHVPEPLVSWFIAHDISDFSRLIVTIRKDAEGWILLEAGKLNKHVDDKYVQSKAND